MANENENDTDLVLAELRKINDLLTRIFIAGKSPHDQIGFLSDLNMSSTEIADYVDMHPGNIRKVVQKWKQAKGKGKGKGKVEPKPKKKNEIKI